MSPSRLASAAVLWLGRLAPIAFAVAALVVLEQSAGPERPAAVDSQPVPEGRRLILFWVDSLALVDMDPASTRMKRLKARLPTGLHGPVRQCADAVSVPCFTAMATGIDHFSLFSLARNFGGVGRLPPGNVFEALQARGKRVGFIGDIMAKKAVEGFDWVEIPPTLDDAYTIRRALEVFEAERLDVVVVHIRETDVTTHTHGPDSPEYLTALEQADRLTDAAFGRFGPEVHIAVFGDHGHTDDGRHFAGLDVPTYASFFGPAFARTAAQPMVITDYGALWARVFGLKFADSDWVSDYFAGRALPVVEGLPGAPGGGSAPPLWALLAVTLLIVATAAPWQWRAHAGPALPALLLGVAGLTLLMLGLGLGWTTLRPYMSYLPRWVNVGLGVLSALAGAALLWPAWRKASLDERTGEAPAFALLAAGAILVSLPTVYKYGGVANAITALVLALALGAALALRARRWLAAAAGGLGVAVAWTIWNPAVRNFKVRWFSVFTEDLAAVIAPVAVGLVVLAIGAAVRPSAHRPKPPAGPASFALGGAVGLALAFAVPHLPPRTWILPCVATPLVLGLGWTRPRLAPLALAVALPAYTFFFHADPQKIAPAAAALALWPLWARARAPRASRLEAAATLLALILTAIWALFGARISGIDFTYFFKWLPPGTAFKETWAQNAVLTQSLYISLPCLGLLLARRVAPRAVDDALGLAWHMARGRLALCLVFIVGFTASGGAGPFITSDVLQSAAVWGTTLLALLLAPGRAARQIGTGVAVKSEHPAALAPGAGGD